MRNVLAAIAAGLVLVAAVGTGWWLLEQQILEAEPGDDPATTLEAYLAAWERGAHAEMAELVRGEPDELVSVHDQLRAGLEPRAVRTRVQGLDEPEDGRAEARVAVEVGLDAVDELGWEVDVELLREAGEWAVRWEHATVHPDLAPGLVFDVATTTLERAPILDVDGRELAGPGQVVVLGLAPGEVTDADDLATAFEEAAEGTGETVADLLARGDLNDEWFYPVTTLPAEEGDEAWQRLRDADGALRRVEEGRTLAEPDLAAHVVGRVAEATAQQLEELGPAYEAGDEVGQFGLEAAFEQRLAGTEEVAVVLRDGAGGPVRETLARDRGSPASPLETTLDLDVQRAVERALLGVDEPAAVVVVDAADGAVRASASRPLAGYNRAFEGRYPPGSTFKVVTAAALLADGAAPDDEVACPATTVVGGLQVSNAGDRDLGATTLREAFAASCNTTFATLGNELGSDALTAAAERFGFGHGPDLPLAAAGGTLGDIDDAAALAATAFGQARVTASPLHLATMAAATESGRWRPPRLLADEDAEERAAEGDDGGAADETAGGAASTEAPAAALDDDALADLQELLRAVVEDGTGAEAGARPGVRGKTGTAETGDDDVAHAWFVGTFDGLGFAVLVEEGGSGGEVAAPLAGRLVAELADR